LKTLTIHRKQFPKFSLGIMNFDDTILTTIECPWIPFEKSLAGKPFESCIGYGMYRLEKHDGQKYKNTVALVSEELDVFHNSRDRENANQRFTCAIHIANYVRDIKGCIGVGLGLTIPGEMITQSANAMKIFRQRIGEYTHINIKPF